MNGEDRLATEHRHPALCETCRNEVPAGTGVCPYCGANLPDPAALFVDPAFLERLSRALGPNFAVGGLLGRGGFADVFEVTDRALRRNLAVKVLRPEIAWGPWMISRFEREARALANLHHLNIPPIHFVGDSEGLVYYVMPLIEGRSLGDMLAASGPLDPLFLVDVMIPILEALEHAHQHGIVHRDIKPDNIVIEGGSNRPLLVDFGVAKQIQAGKPESSLPGVVLGTPGYISPEQAMGHEAVDARSDVYAAGATMFHLLTGITTFQGETPREIIGKQITGEVPVPADLNQRIPAWLSDVILCALSREPDRRYQSAAAMAEALRAGRRLGGSAQTTAGGLMRRIRQDDPTPPMVPVYKGAPPASPVPPPWARRGNERRRRRPASRAAMISRAVVVALLVALLAWLFVVPQRFVLRNELAVPVEISANEEASQVVPPRGRFVMGLPDDGRVVARWFVVQPAVNPSGPGAEPASGIIRVESVTLLEVLSRKLTRSVDPWMPGNLLFAPRITNATNLPLRVYVNGSTGDGNCACQVLPGETRLLGYYGLEPNASVLVTDDRGRSVRFTQVESLLDPDSGVLDLTIDDTTLSRSPSP